MAEGILPGGDVIFIGTRGGIKAGMRLLFNRQDVVDGYVARQESVEFLGQEREVGNWLFPLKVGYHHAGMHAGIGASGSHDRYGFAEQGGERLFQELLYRNSVGLYLPAIEGGAVVT